MDTKLTAKLKNGVEECATQASIPVMREPPLPEAPASTFTYSDSDDEDVDEVLVVDSPQLLPHPGGSRADPAPPPLNMSLLEQSPPSRCNSNNRHSIPSSSTADLHNFEDTPPPPPPLNQRRPHPDDDLVVPPTPESEPKTSRTYADVVKFSSSDKNHRQQPQENKLKSILIDPAHREVPPHRAGVRVRFADSPSCYATSRIDSSRSTLSRRVEYPQEELHHSPTHTSRNDGSMTRLSPRIRKIIEGRCFNCLARGHWAAACQDPVTCFRCRRSGHRERDCRRRHQHPHQSSTPRPHPREDHSSGHHNDCVTERLHLRSDDPALHQFFTEHANYFQHEIKKVLDTEIQSLHSEFSLLLDAQLQKLQDSNKKWMKLAENLMLQIDAMSVKLNITSALNQVGSGVNQATTTDMQANDDMLSQLHDTQFAMSKVMATPWSQEPRIWGDQLHRPKEIVHNGSPMKVAATSSKIDPSSCNKSAIPEVTIQDVEDALLQLEIAAAKEPPLRSVSCCSPTDAADGESNSLLLSVASANAKPSCPIIQSEMQTIDSSAQIQIVEFTTPTLEMDASSSVLTSHQVEDTELTKVTSEPTTRLTSRRCRYRQGFVYTRRPRCGSGRTRRGFGSVVDVGACRDIQGQGDTMPPSSEDGGQSAHEVMLANFIQSVTKPVEQPLLPPQQLGPVQPRKEKMRPSKPSRRSARLAAIAWPRGDAQSRARQVLMKKLGVTQEEGETREMMFLRCAKLIKGPMSDLVFKALVGLSGLDKPAMSG